MSKIRMRIIKGPIAPIPREKWFWDEYTSQPFYNVRLSDGRVISTFRDFLDEDEESALNA